MGQITKTRNMLANAKIAAYKFLAQLNDKGTKLDYMKLLLNDWEKAHSMPDMALLNAFTTEGLSSNTTIILKRRSGRLVSNRTNGAGRALLASASFGLDGVEEAGVVKRSSRSLSSPLSENIVPGGNMGRLKGNFS